MGLSAFQFKEFGRLRRAALLCACASAALLSPAVTAAPPNRSPAAADQLRGFLARRDGGDPDILQGVAPSQPKVGRGGFEIGIEVPAPSIRGKSGIRGCWCSPGGGRPRRRSRRSWRPRMWPRVEQALRVMRRISGMPDYAAHVEHLRRCHPERPLLSPAEFYEEFLRTRYGDGPTRCC
jgi:uncharacterized short protein YbdD (DUF466 family)